MVTKKESYRRDYDKHRDGYLRRAKKSYLRSQQNVEQRLKRMLTEARARAKKTGVEFDLTCEDVTWNTHCPIFGLELVLDNYGSGGKWNSPSLDRIDNTKGYVKGNVRIISNRANKLKNNMTKEECMTLLENWDEVTCT